MGHTEEKGKKKIPFVMVFDYLELGGGTRSLVHIARALASQYSLYLVVGIVSDIDTKKIHQELKKYCAQIYSYTIPSRLGYVRQGMFIMWKTWRLCVYLRKHLLYRRLLIHLPFSGAGALLASFGSSVKKIAICHGVVSRELSSHYTRTHPPYRWYKRLYEFVLKYCMHMLQYIVLRSAQKIFVFSTYTKNILFHQYSRLNTHTVFVLHPPFFPPLAHRVKKAKKFTVCVVARMEPRKGIDVVIGAFASPALQNAQCVIIGPAYDKEYQRLLFEYIAAYDVSDKVFFLGEKTHEESLQWLSYCHLTVVPSVELETFGFITVESLSMKTPVVGFQSGATPEILMHIDPHFVVSPITPEALAKRIRWYQLLSFQKKQLYARLAKHVIQTQYSKTQFTRKFSCHVEGKIV